MLCLLILICAATQAVMLVNILYFLILCFVTLPMYSLAVHMGKELRQDAFPPELRERLQRARSQHEQVLPHACCIVRNAARRKGWREKEGYPTKFSAGSASTQLLGCQRQPMQGHKSISPARPSCDWQEMAQHLAELWRPELQVRGNYRQFLDLLKLPGPSRPKGIPGGATNGAGPEGGRQSSEQAHSTPLVTTPHSTAKGE